MIGRNKNWTGPSDWINEFNRVHNPDIYYGKQKKTKEKKTKTKKTGRANSSERYPVFKVQD